MADTEDTIDNYVKGVEDTFGKCKLNKHTYTNCAVRYTKDEDGHVTLDQDEYIKQLRPIQHPGLTGADADARATKMEADMFVILRGALAYTLITQVWLMVYVVSLQRIQEPTNIQVRRLNAISENYRPARRRSPTRRRTPRARSTYIATQAIDA
eukprot:3221282-Pyramimonas_sp.AAC.1